MPAAPATPAAPAAQRLIDHFLDHFRGVKAYLANLKAAARAQGAVHTMAGRSRPLKGLAAADKK